MGAFPSLGSTVLPALSTAASTIGSINRLFSGVDTLTGLSDRRDRRNDRRADGQALDQLVARQRNAEKDAAEKMARDKELLQASASEDEQRRVAALKRAVARQKAQFGGRGVSSEGGSAEAVLLGLFDESEAERSANEKITALRTQALDDQVGQLRRRNLLEATQLAARQQLQQGARF